MHSSEKSGLALSYDALSTASNFVFDSKNPAPVSIAVNPRGNMLQALCLRNGFDDDAAILTRALRDGNDYTFDGQTLTVNVSYLAARPQGEYTILSAIFNRGQSISFSVWSEPEQPMSVYEILDFDKAEAPGFNDQFKNEYFQSAELLENAGPDGRKALLLSYDFTLWPLSVSAYFEIKQKFFIQAPSPRAVSFWIYGDGSHNLISLRVHNRSRATVETENDICLDWSGWKQVYFYFPEEMALPIAWWEVLRLRRGSFSCTPSGEIRIGKIEVLCDPALAVRDSSYREAIPTPYDEGSFTIDFSGLIKGQETTVWLTQATNYIPNPPVVLRCAAAVDKKDNPLDFAMPYLTFGADQTLTTRSFTDERFPGDAIFALYAQDAAGTCSAVRWLVSAPKHESYSPLPSRIIRNITKNPETEAAFSFVTDTDTTEAFLSIRKAHAPESETVFIPSDPRFGREAEMTVHLCGVPVTLDREYMSHSVQVDGLSPGVEYSCRLGGGSHWTEPFTLTTLQPENRCFAAVILSDAQNGSNPYFHEAYRDLIRRGIRRTQNSAFIIELGDLVDKATDLMEYQATISASQEEFRKYAFAPTPGNHERDILRRHANYVSHWNTPPCSLPEYRNLMYSFDVCDYHFTSLPVDDECPADAVVTWLDNDLTASDRKWKVVLLHSPPYGAKNLKSCGRKLLVPILEKHNVDLCLSGHEHIYVRASMCGGRNVPIGQGITYLTMGTSGPKAYEGCRNSWQDFVYGDKYTERFHGKSPDLTTAVVHFSPDRITIDVQMTSGRVVDYIVLEK